MQALAAQVPRLQLGDGWFGTAAEGAGRASEFSGALAEAMYACAAQALALLAALAPEVAHSRFLLNAGYFCCTFALALCPEMHCIAVTRRE